MKRIRKHIALAIAIALIYSIFAGLSTGVLAAEMPVTVMVESYEDEVLTISWSQMPGARAAEITYHEPDPDDNAIPAEPIIVSGASTAEITGLKADYIYDINVTVYGAVDVNGEPVGDPIGSGLLFFLPSITFTASAVQPEPPYDAIEGGGRETGARPKLKLNWKIPKVYTDSDNAFIDAGSNVAKEFMEDSLNRIYTNDLRDLSSLNFRINISTRMNLLNSGSAQAAILVDQDIEDDNRYEAYISGFSDPKAVLALPDAQGFRSFILEGRADDISELPEDIAGDDILPNGEILPGTVYYMNIKPVYKESDGEIGFGSVVAVGDPDEQNGSLLSGERSYVNTPIRFQLTKDSANNIYVKIFKINQGSLDLPRLYYEVQATDDPSIQGDWEVKKTMDDTYFNGDFAITVLSGVNPNNTIFYKITVKSENPDDRLESLAMPYTLTVDTSRPPLPMGIVVIDRKLHTEIVDFPSEDDPTDPDADDMAVKSTDITLSWEKPLNWDEIKDDLYFHFLLSTNQSVITEKVPIYVNGVLWGKEEGYDVKYRLTKYISAISPDIKDVGNRLEYTLDGFDLFTWDDVDDVTMEESSGEIEPGSGDENYPDFLIPNTVYYLQMYTTNAENAADAGDAGADEISDRSIIASFTTLNGVELDVPLPMSFELQENGKMIYGGSEVNYVDLRFDKVLNLDWSNYTTDYNELEYDYDIYYDIYMNSRTNTEFVPVGTTQDLDGDIGFTGADDLQSTSIIARISHFTEENTQRLVDCGLLDADSTRTPRTMFGDNLLPNTTYYFKVKTRLVARDRSNGQVIEEKESMYTAILPVTTILLDVTPPDDSRRKPLAPTDFRIAESPDGDLLVSGSNVTFTWLRQENDVIYQIIRTTGKIDPTADPPEYENDPEYTGFLEEYDPPSEDMPERGVIYLDPIGDPAHNYPGKFSYDTATGVCTFTVDRAMFPNKLYYFSLKAVRVDQAREPLEPGAESVWVSIPVTTSLIDPPRDLEPVYEAELGFWWTDDTVGMTAEDYRIYVKGPSDPAFKLMTRAQSTIVKDADQRTYYGRVTGLEFGTGYDIRVAKGSDTTVYEGVGMMTRDSYHELEIRWTGKLLDNYERYEIAIMEEGASEYTVLTAADLELYVDKNGSILPYYTEETARTLKSDELCYHARIKTMNVTLPGGITTKQPLRSNMRYYIKIRSVKMDPVETDLISYSKYIGPVSTRTEFNQDDYDDEDRKEQQKAAFLDRMADLEKKYYWRVDIGTNHITSILLKGDRIADAMKNTTADSFVVDIAEISLNIRRDEIYVPVLVIDAMRSLKKSLVIRTDGTELMLRPGTMNASFKDQIDDIMDRQDVKDIYVKLDLEKVDPVYPSLPTNQLLISEIKDLEVQAQGVNVAYIDMAEMFHDRLYNEDTGLVGEMLDRLQNTYIGSGKGSSGLIDQYTQSLVELIEEELSEYIDNTLRSSRLGNAIREITTFDTPVTASFSVNDAKGVKVPYALYDGSSTWQKVSAGVVVQGSAVRFGIVGTGRFVILAPKNAAGDVKGHWAEESITALASGYDLEDVFPGLYNSFMPDNRATCTEVVLLFERVAGKAFDNSGLNVRQKLIKLGLDDKIHTNSLVRDVERQQAAAVLLELFSVKKGLDAGSLRPGGRITMYDEDEINEDYYLSAVIIVDMAVMDLDGSGRFYPRDTMTRAEVADAFVRMLKLTGDL